MPLTAVLAMQSIKSPAVQKAFTFLYIIAQEALDISSASAWRVHVYMSALVLSTLLVLTAILVPSKIFVPSIVLTHVPMVGMQ